MIQFKDVYKQYKEQHNALADISVEISDGEFVFLIGSSGAGKTTFLKLLLREMLPSKGKVIIDGQDLSKISRNKIHLLRRKVGMVFQDFKLLTDRTVFENIAIALEILGKSDQEITKEVLDVLDLVDLVRKKNLFPKELSQGEMQRVSIARAIAGGPKILLADEPTGNLDPEISWQIMDLLKQIHKIGTTIVMATHNEKIVNEMKTRTLILNKGKLESDDSKGKYHLPQIKKSNIK